MLHVRCGDDILEALRSLGRGPAVKWCDPLCQGPAPSGLRGAAWRAVRARFLADAYGPRYADALAALAAEDRALMQGAKHDEIVLWFEADLFDQSILMALLARFGPCLRRATRLSLVCIGAHPDVPRFIGLGQLSAAQLDALLPRRDAVTAAQVALAAHAFAAFRDPDPRALAPFLRDDGTLPFLADALRRHAAEFPAVPDGLGLTERSVLERLAEGAADPSTLFRAVQAREARPWLGDLMLWRIVQGLAAPPVPLIRIDGPHDWWRDRATLEATTMRLTAAGERILSGKDDRIALSPVDRWHGGVRLHPGGPDWRWDAAAGEFSRIA